ncbi:MAG: hypothetical protein M3Z97_10275, partial [Candidatus Dormibacteraeota bacterium]|nr:hypothetical protein [Candidatus Dormibacteraeota bacterium]
WAVLVSAAGVVASNTSMSIVHTSDGGRHWKRADVPGMSTYALTKFFDATHGIVSTRTQTEQILYSTADGGQRWRSSQLPGQGNPDALSLVFLDPRRGWYLEQASAVLPNSADAQVPEQSLWRTLDGGASWTQLVGLDAVHQPFAGGLHYGGFKALGNFIDERHGSLVSVPDAMRPSPTFYLTAEGGQTWTPLAVPQPPDALMRQASHGMSFRLFQLPDLLVELIRTAGPSGLNDFTRVSGDGGASWTTVRPLPVGPNVQLVLPQFEDSRHWCLAAGRLLWRTSDAGETWQSQPAAIPASLSISNLQVIGHKVMWAVAARDDAPDGPDHLLRSLDGGVHWEDQGPPALQLVS